MAKNDERSAGPANSVPSPTSHTILGVSWYLSPTSVPRIVDSPRTIGCSAKTSAARVARVNCGAPIRVASAERELVAAVTFSSPRAREDFISSVEMDAKSLDGFGDDAFELDTVAMGIDPRRRRQAQLGRERRKA